MLPLIIILLIPVGGMVFIIWKTIQDQRAIQEAANDAYQKSLATLKEHPNDSLLREEVLRLGRELSQLSREDGKETVFDELAIKNDIDAACAGVVSEKTIQRDEKECPECAELVLRKAKRCKHCGHELADGQLVHA